ncbi:MAG: TIR domain-containing protein, partial [Chloroflexi bacterium]
MPRIFISYRRADSVTITGRIYDRLVAEYSDRNVFKDVDDIPLGADFRRVLDEEVGSCDVLLVIIGQQWLTLEENGQRRLDNPDDFVRIEVEAGLNRNDVLVIPVLVKGAGMPS